MLVNGAISGGFSIMQLPVANAGAIFQTLINSG